MPALLIYLLKANIALTLFFLAYRWGLRRLTFYVLNRFFLLAGIVCSSIFPLVDVNNLLESHQKIEEVVAYVPDLGALQAQPAVRFYLVASVGVYFLDRRGGNGYPFYGAVVRLVAHPSYIAARPAATASGKAAAQPHQSFLFLPPYLHQSFPASAG